jgi:hypothetical protein
MAWCTVSSQSEVGGLRGAEGRDRRPKLSLWRPKPKAQSPKPNSTGSNVFHCLDIARLLGKADRQPVTTITPHANNWLVSQAASLTRCRYHRRS